MLKVEKQTTSNEKGRGTKDHRESRERLRVGIRKGRKRARVNTRLFGRKEEKKFLLAREEEQGDTKDKALPFGYKKRNGLWIKKAKVKDCRGNHAGFPGKSVTEIAQIEGHRRGGKREKSKTYGSTLGRLIREGKRRHLLIQKRKNQRSPGKT